MDMSLSKRGDYVTRAAIALARAYDAGTPRKVREVVAETDLPPTFAAQILADLVRAGLATSKAGRVGGYRLSRPPGTISVLEVIEAGEGPLRSEHCALGAGPCRWEAVCPLHETWTAATAALRELLSQTTLAELAARDAAIEAGTYRPPADSHRSHPGSVAVSDGVQVELSGSELSSALRHSAGRLASLVGEAADAATEVDAALTPDGSFRDDGAVRERSLLQLRLAGPRRTTVLEATVEVSEVDPERSAISVQGDWHQHGEPGTLLDEAALRDEARRSTRAFLRKLAGLVEQPGLVDLDR